MTISISFSMNELLHGDVSLVTRLVIAKITKLLYFTKHFHQYALFATVTSNFFGVCA